MRFSWSNFGVFLLSFGISLFFVFVPLFGSSVTISVPDLIFGILMIWGAFRLRRLKWSAAGLLAILFSLTILLSGMVNSVLSSSFDAKNFLVNFIRIVGIAGMVVILPPVIMRLGQERLAIAGLWTLRIHCVLVLLQLYGWDVLALIGVDEGMAHQVIGVVGKFTRPGGLFGVEPSYFTLYVALTLLFVIQVQRNRKKNLLRGPDVGLTVIAVLASTSISGIGMVIVILLILVGSRRSIERRQVMIGLVMVVAGLLIALFFSPKEGLGDSLAYLQRRIPLVFSFEFVDNSSRQRIIGGTLGMWKILQDAPLLGKGLGGANVERLYAEYKDPMFTQIAPLSFATFPAHIMATSGFLGLLLFFSIIGVLASRRQSRLIAFSIVLIGFCYGGVFETIIWWYIAMGISLVGSRKHPDEGFDLQCYPLKKGDRAYDPVPFL